MSPRRLWSNIKKALLRSQHPWALRSVVSESEFTIAFRQAMRRLVASVCVVSVECQGERQAITVSSLIPVSIQPPSVLVSINHDAEIYPLLEQAERFCVNILSEDQQDISVLCAQSKAGDERFSLGEWQCHQGMWWLRGACVNFFCILEQRVPYATHDLVIGKVLETRVSDSEDAATLLYWDGEYGSIRR